MAEKTTETVTTATPPTPVAPAPRPRRMWPLVVLVVLVILGAAGGGIALLLLNSSPATHPEAPLSVSNDLKLTLAEQKGTCDTTYGFTATASLSGTGDLAYKWERSDGTASAPATIHVDGSMASLSLHQAWRLTGAQKVSGTMTFHLLAPRDQKVSTTFTFACP